MISADYQQIPFYGNTADNTHCFQAGMKMLLGYYFPKEDFSWESLEELTGKKDGKWTWPMKGWLYLAERGLDITYYGTFDYEKFAQSPEEYLFSRTSKEVATAQIRNSDILYEASVAKELVQKINQEKRIPAIVDISNYIADGYLVFCNVNYYPLYGKEGYSGHFVLIYGIDEEYVYLHDPGLPPNPSAKIPLKNFIAAWEYSGVENKGLTVVRRPI